MSYLTPLRSDLKLSILLSLLEGKKKLAELGEEAKTRETTILHVLKELEQLELTTRSDGTYQLTMLGVLEAQICKGCYNAFDVLKKYKDFWLTHDVSGIPPRLMMKLGDLGDSVLIKSTGVDQQKVHRVTIDMLRSSKTIVGISPIFHIDYIDAVTEILAQGGNVVLIVSSEVLEKIKQEDPHPEITNRFISSGNLQIYLNDDLRFALTVTEKIWSLGFFSLSGEYDYLKDLRGSGEEGIEWGTQLFKTVLKESTKL